MKYLQDGTTKECLTHFTGCPQLYCARDRGISRIAKREKRVKKRAQHEQNVMNRNSSGKK